MHAGVAGGIALGVLQCEHVHSAGVAPIMIRLAGTWETASISGLGPWRQGLVLLQTPRILDGIALSHSGWIMPFGSPGNDVQPQAMPQASLNRVVFGMAPQAAIEQPRFASGSFPGSSDPHACAPRRMTQERRFDATAASPSRMGQNVNGRRDRERKAGCVRAIVKDHATGLPEGGADVRRPGGVRGW